MRFSVFSRVLCLLVAFLLCAPLVSVAHADAYDATKPDKLTAEHLAGVNAILIEADTGEVIFEKSPDQIAYPASTTKIMTAYLAITRGDLDAVTTVSARAIDVPEDSSKLKIAEGEEIVLRDLVYGTMLSSGNDGANAIAEAVAGSIEAFVEMMNQTAVDLGCTSTHFVNAHGYHDENHYTTARDLAIIARAAMENDTFRHLVSQTSFAMPRDNIYRSRSIATNNDFLIRADNSTRYYEYGTGIKTGRTSAAGSCYVGSALKDGISLISVVLGCEKDVQRYTDTIKLMNYGFSQYLSTSISEIYALNPKVIEISRFALDDANVGRLELKLTKVDPRSTDTIVTTQSQLEYWVQNFSSLTVTEFTRAFEAPIEAGEIMGTITYYPEVGLPVEYQLTATRSVAARTSLAPSIDQIVETARNDPNPFPRFTFELLLLYGILPATGIVLLIKAIRIFTKKAKKRRVHTMRPTERYYR